MGMVHAYKKGKLKNSPDKVKEVAKHISDKDAKDFASTKTKGLSEKKASYLDQFFVRGFLSGLGISS